jgi:SET domain-containing protein
LLTPCFNLPLPGGRSISYNQDTGVLRIQLEEQQQQQQQRSVNEDGLLVVSKVTLDSIVVRDTKTVKGHGAYATANLSANTFLGLYEGTMIRSRESLEAKYSRSGTQKKINGMDYVLSLDGGVTFLDGSERAMDRSSFSPVHLNHADRETWQCNCIRELLQDNQVAFFTARDIIEGEELCFNYGNNFWKGREHLKQ